MSNVQVSQTGFVIITRCIRAQKRAGTPTKRNSFNKLTLKFSAFMRAFIALKEALRLPNISGSIVWNLKKKMVISNYPVVCKQGAIGGETGGDGGEVR